MTPVITLPPSILINTSNEVFDTVLRRRLRAEIAEIRNQINRFNSTDPLSNLISRWAQDFSESLNVRNVNEQAVLREYIRLLQEILVDSLTNTPLDDEALLGSDGRTYGYKHLCLHIIDVGEEYRSRSPIYPLDPAPFSTKEHTLARYMIRWLERHNSKLESEEINRAFSDLDLDQVEFLIPNEINDRIRRIVRRQLLREQPNSQFEEFCQNTLNNFTNLLNQQAALFRNNQERFRTEVLGNLSDIQQRDDASRELINRNIEVITGRIEENTQDIEGLRERLRDLEGQIDEARKEDLNLQIKIKELDQAIQESKSDHFFTIIAVVGSVFITWGLSSVFTANIGAVLIPKTGGIGASVIVAV